MGTRRVVPLFTHKEITCQLSDFPVDVFRYLENIDWRQENNADKQTADNQI